MRHAAAFRRPRAVECYVAYGAISSEQERRRISTDALSAPSHRDNTALRADHYEIELALVRFAEQCSHEWAVAETHVDLQKLLLPV